MTLQDYLKNLDPVPLAFLTLTPLFAFSLLGVYLYLYEFTWGFLLLFTLFYSATAMSITAGYHRLWSHKAYEAGPILRLFYALFGAAAFQNSIYKWSVDHRLHHRHVDTDLDPYSINKGFFYAHMGWMISKQEWPPHAKAYGRDLENDKIVMWQDRNYVPIAIVMGFFLPTLIGHLMGNALGGLVFGALLRMVALHHGTFLINSACHFWGSRPYTIENTARDNIVLAFLTFGEGYHNFHHLFATDYRNGIRWYHWDPTKWLIKLSNWLGLSENLKKTSEAKIQEARWTREQSRFQQSLDKLNASWALRVEELQAKVESAQNRFLELKLEYKRLKSEKTEASRNKLIEIRMELKLAKQEWKSTLYQWRLVLNKAPQMLS
ncbi:MAG: fatty acid desaturase [Pseudomonadota bacterium]